MKGISTRITTAIVLGFSYIAASLTPVWADDIDVFFNEPSNSSTTNNSKPNVLFVFDTSPSFENNINGTETSRSDAAKAVLKDFIQSNGGLVNIGVARLNNYGAAIVFPVSDTTATLTSLDPSVANAPTAETITINNANDDGIQTGTTVTLTQTSSYTFTAENTGTTIGFRFRNVDVPRNAVITGAKLVLTNKAASTGTASYQIEGELNGKSNDFSAAIANDFTTRSKTNTVPWTPIAATANSLSESSDIKSIIQSIVAHSEWCGGRSLNLFITPASDNTGMHNWFAYEGGSSTAPQLQITYSEAPAGQPTCKLQEKTYNVQTSNDDAYEEDDFDIQTNYDYLKLHAGHKSAVRFTGIRLPEANLLEEAYLELTADGSTTSATTFTISGQQSTAPNYFSDAEKDITNRPLVTATKDWALTNWTDKNAYPSENIVDIIKAIRNSNSPAVWSNPGSMVLRIDHKSGSNRKAFTYEESPAYAARLHVVYRDEGTGSFERTVGDELISNFDQMLGGAESVTRLGFWEGLTYFRGENVYSGTSRGTAENTNLKRKGRVSHKYSLETGTYSFNTSSLSGCTSTDYNAEACQNEINNANGKIPRYKSPITTGSNSCSGNHLVLVSDNGKDGSGVDEATIMSKIGISSCRSATPDGTTFGNNKCIAEAAWWLNNTDQAPGIDGIQTVKTHFILWDNEPLPGDAKEAEYIAKQGGGKYFFATTGDELKSAMSNVTRDALVNNSTFVAPAAPVNSLSKLYNLDELYFSVFQPTKYAHWAGNLKKYKYHLVSGSNPEDLKTVEIIDTNGKSAVYISGDKAGTFDVDAQSFWSTEKDGSKVTTGGAASKISYSTRKVYTFTGSYSGTTPSQTSLTHSSNIFNTENPALTEVLLDTTAADRNNLIEWARGKDGDSNNTRHVIGDPLHSAPAVVSYRATPASQSTSASQDNIIFITTNAGFLHAIDANSGEEKFSFIPKELLQKLKDQRSNIETNSHIYGLDSTIKTWVYDKDRDGNIESADGDHVYLYFGMRRGGKNYYAIDATDIEHPKLKWVIKGGETTDFDKLGQSWAQPVLTRINYTVASVSQIKNVLIISGGYDTAHDNKDTRSDDNIGNALYIVDAQTGEKIWSGGKDNTNFTESFSEMKYSITSTPAAIDINLDGYADQLYVGDLGGQVWRFDINKGNALNDLVSGGVIADLGTGSAADNSAANNRRFYHAPGLSLSREYDGDLVLNVLIGSGYREKPLSKTTHERFYRIKQSDVFRAKNSYGTPIKENDLYDATTDVIGKAITTAEKTALADLESKSGWMIKLPENTGEKVMSTPTIYEGTVHFTTYEPVMQNSCAAQFGTNRAWSIKVGTAAGSSWQGVEGPRSVASVGVSFIDKQTTMVTPDGDVIAFPNSTMPENTGEKITDGMNKTYWY